jgi:hypothetical protein
MNELFTVMNKQMQAHITSNAGNRWTSIRIDSQAFLIATSFAFVSMFFTTITTPN